MEKYWTSKRKEPRVPFDFRIEKTEVEPPTLGVCYKLFWGYVINCFWRKCYELFLFDSEGSCEVILEIVLPSGSKHMIDLT